jgi:hypothetical protein
MNTDWKKRDTPTPMLVAVALLVIYAVIASLVAITERSWVIGGFALLAAVGAVGTATLKAWSRYVVYVLAAALVVKSAYSIYTASAAGFFNTFETRKAAIWSLVPGVVMTMLFLLACWIVHRQFSTAGNAAGPRA